MNGCEVRIYSSIENKRLTHYTTVCIFSKPDSSLLQSGRHHWSHYSDVRSTVRRVVIKKNFIMCPGSSTKPLNTRQLQRYVQSSLYVCVIARAEPDGTRAETTFRLSPKRTSPFKSVGATVQSTAGSRGVRISLSNAG